MDREAQTTPRRATFIFSGILFLGVFTLAVGLGLVFFEANHVTSEVKIISAQNYDDFELREQAVAGISSSQLINVNSASASDLEALPGVGPVTVGKIISGRPYSNLEELVFKKAVGRALFERISPQLTVGVE